MTSSPCLVTSLADIAEVSVASEALEEEAHSNGSFVEVTCA